MADFGMFGYAQSGARLAQQDSIAEFLHLAQGQHEQALAQQQQEKTKQMRAERLAMSQLTTPDGQGGPGAGGSIADIFDFQSKQLIAKQQPMAALKWGETAAKIRLDEARTAEVQAGEGLKQLQTQQRQLDLVGRIYSGADSPEKWSAAGMLAVQQFPGDKSILALASQPFNPQTAERLSAAMLSQKDKLQAEQDRLRTGILQTNSNTLTDLRTARKEVLGAQKANFEARTMALEKNGGSTGRNTPIGIPSDKQQADARKMFEGYVPGLPPEEVEAAGLQIASEARAAIGNRSAPDWNTALQRATATALKDVETLKKTYGVGGFTVDFGQRKAFGGGKTAKAALPATKDTAFKAGRYYQTPKGPLKFLGEDQWERPADSSSRQAPDSSDSGLDNQDQ